MHAEDRKAGNVGRKENNFKKRRKDNDYGNFWNGNNGNSTLRCAHTVHHEHLDAQQVRSRQNIIAKAGHDGQHHQSGLFSIQEREKKWSAGQKVTRRLPSSCSAIVTFSASPGNSSSISSGHSMKHSAPL